MSLFHDISSYRARTKKSKCSLEPLLQARSDGPKGKSSIPFLARLTSDLVRILRKKITNSGKTPNPTRFILFCFVTSLSNFQESARRHWNEANRPCGAQDRPLEEAARALSYACWKDTFPVALLTKGHLCRVSRHTTCIC